MNGSLTLERTQEAGLRHVLHVLLLLQGALGLLTGLAMLILMAGNPLAWPVTLGGPLLMFVLAAGSVRGWRWTRGAIVLVEALVLIGFGFGMLLGLVAALDYSLNLVTLMTNLALPLSILVLVKNPGLVLAGRVESADQGPAEVRVAA
jgi:hypothetical protein